jgi:cyclopropane fatty-acyl-phospholipid synthase-like methyltransferase
MEEEMEIDIHGGLPREAAGDSESTKKAFSLLEGLPSNPSILDVGCGPGASAIELAKLGALVTAVDVRQQFLDEAEKRAFLKGVADRIKTTRQSMFEMDFPPQAFDVIWSEGAVFVMGFENGLLRWKKFLKQKGYMVLTELSWFTQEPSAEPKAFWGTHYPGMRSVEDNIASLEQSGYQITHHFNLPESSWWNEYYGPWEAKLHELKARHENNTELLRRIEKGLEEIDLYRKFSNEYGYTFYISQLVE